MTIAPGARLHAYVVEDCIAHGGMGSVWRGRDTRRNELVAIKAIANDLMADPEFRVRIRDEARRHQRLQHPHIVPVPDVFAAEGATCIVMKLIDGPSLSSVLEGRPGGRLEIEEAVRIVRDVLLALDYAHRNGIVHRDVKPSNILLDRTGWVWLCDFGVAIAMGEQRRTRAGVTVGTLAYMSPEQITHPRTIDHRSDVYSVGCLLYELVTGRPPFVRNEDGVGNTDFAIQQAHVKKQPVNPRQRVPNVPPELDQVIMQALEKNPDDRIPGCQEFARRLDQIGKAAEESAAPVPPAGPGHGRRAVAVVLVTAALLLLVWYLLT
jgi:serine/threonine protein kinase